MYEISFKSKLEGNCLTCTCHFCRYIARIIPSSSNIRNLVSVCPHGTKINFNLTLDVIIVAQFLNTALREISLVNLCLERLINIYPDIVTNVDSLYIPDNLKETLLSFESIQYKDFDEIAYLSNFSALVRHHIGMYIIVKEIWDAKKTFLFL